MTVKATWLERRPVNVRPLEWSRSVAANDDAPVADGGGESDAPVEHAPVVHPVSAEDLAASELMLATRTTELEHAEAELATLREEMLAVRATATDARQALADVTAKTVAAAEIELVKLALAIAERVVGRELATSPEIIVGWAREAIAASSLGEGLAIAVSEDVAISVAEQSWGDLAPGLVTDASLPPATCEVRDGKTAITLGGEGRLDLVAEQLAAIPARAA